jgi:hypothetical protein
MFNLLYQLNVRYEIYVNVKDIAATRFGTSVPFSGSAVARLKTNDHDKLLFTRFHSLE